MAMKWVAVFGLLVGVVPLARADPYWITYEGDAFPENDGWTRVHGSMPAERWLDDGKLFIDSRADLAIYDYVKMTFDGNLDPGPGETFVMRWRLRVDDEEGFYDPAIGVTSNEVAPDVFYRAAFGFREDRVLSALETGVSAPLEPGIFHEYELRSFDMRAYALYIDGDLAIRGVFTEVFGPTRVSWGDTVSGATSLSEWDYVQFGVVPEPAAWMCAALLALWSCRAMWRARRRTVRNRCGSHEEYAIMGRGAAVLVVMFVAHSAIAENHIREWSAYYVEGTDYSIDQDTRTVLIHKNSVPAQFWKFEAYDDATPEPHEPGDIDDIRIEPTGTVGEIHLRVLGAPGHQYGARNVKRIDLLTNSDGYLTEIYSVYVSGDLGGGEDDRIEAKHIGGILANGSLLHTLSASQEITGDVVFHGNLLGLIVAPSAQNITFTGTGDQTGDITINGPYLGQLSIAGPMSGAITIDGNLAGSVTLLDDLSGSLNVDGDVSGSVKIGGNGPNYNVGILSGTVDIAGDVLDTTSEFHIHHIQDGHFECQNLCMTK
jgi:hypothetical protein